MDEHKEEQEDKFLESSEQQQPLKHEAAEKEEDKETRTAEEEEPTVQVQLKEVVEGGGSEQASSSPFGGIFAYPCSLLRYLLRAFSAGWCWAWPPLHGAFGDNGKKTQQAVAPEPAAPAVNSTEQGGGAGGEKTGNCVYMEEEVVVTQVWAVRRGRQPPGGPPSRPREGRGGNGGVHH